MFLQDLENSQLVMGESGDSYDNDDLPIEIRHLEVGFPSSFHVYKYSFYFGIQLEMKYFVCPSALHNITNIFMFISKFTLNTSKIEGLWSQSAQKLPKYTLWDKKFSQ